MAFLIYSNLIPNLTNYFAIIFLWLPVFIMFSALGYYLKIERNHNIYRIKEPSFLELYDLEDWGYDIS